MPAAGCRASNGALGKEELLYNSSCKPAAEQEQCKLLARLHHKDV